MHCREQQDSVPKRSGSWVCRAGILLILGLYAAHPRAVSRAQSNAAAPTQPGAPTQTESNNSVARSPARAPAVPAQTAGAAGPRHFRTLFNLDDELKSLTVSLNLDPKQQEMVKAMLQHRQARLRRIFEDRSLSAVDRFAAIKAVHEKSDEQISGILNAEQVSKFDQLRHRAPAAKAKPDGAEKNPESGESKKTLESAQPEKNS